MKFAKRHITPALETILLKLFRYFQAIFVVGRLDVNNNFAPLGGSDLPAAAGMDGFPAPNEGRGSDLIFSLCC